MYTMLTSEHFINRQSAVDWLNDHKNRLKEAKEILIKRCMEHCEKGDCWASLSDLPVWPPSQQLVEIDLFGYMGIYMVMFECKCRKHVDFHYNKEPLIVKFSELGKNEIVPFNAEQYESQIKK